MSAHRSTIGIAALWATLCVVLLACGWLNGAAASSPSTPWKAGLATLQDVPSAAWARLKTPPAPAPEAPLSETSITVESGADPDTGSHATALRLGRPAWVAVVPLWPADALRWPLLEPSLRLNPGHAPPYA